MATAIGAVVAGVSAELEASTGMQAVATTASPVTAATRRPRRMVWFWIMEASSGIRADASMVRRGISMVVPAPPSHVAGGRRLSTGAEPTETHPWVHRVCVRCRLVATTGHPGLAEVVRWSRRGSLV